MYEKQRDGLLATREELVRRVEALRHDASQPLERDSEEQATQLENAEVQSGLEVEALREIDEIDAALTRIEGGNYGICVSCGESIPPARLKAYPAAVRCIGCADT